MPRDKLVQGYAFKSNQFDVPQYRVPPKHEGSWSQFGWRHGIVLGIGLCVFACAVVLVKCLSGCQRLCQNFPCQMLGSTVKLFVKSVDLIWVLCVVFAMFDLAKWLTQCQRLCPKPSETIPYQLGVEYWRKWKNKYFKPVCNRNVGISHDQHQQSCEALFARIPYDMEVRNWLVHTRVSKRQKLVALLILVVIKDPFTWDSLWVIGSWAEGQLRLLGVIHMFIRATQQHWEVYKVLDGLSMQ